MHVEIYPIIFKELQMIIFNYKNYVFIPVISLFPLNFKILFKTLKIYKFIIFLIKFTIFN